MPDNALALLTPDDAAAALGCCAQTVREQLASGHLPGVKYGRDWRIPVDALRQHLASEAMKNIGRREPPRRPAAVLHAIPARKKRSTPPALPPLADVV